MILCCGALVNAELDRKIRVREGSAPRSLRVLVSGTCSIPGFAQ
jgi:hypothetical protein